jgi:hypothetical protein
MRERERERESVSIWTYRETYSLYIYIYIYIYIYLSNRNIIQKRRMQPRYYREAYICTDMYVHPKIKEKKNVSHSKEPHRIDEVVGNL